jgi:prepilin-type N-terminal cleavage/methylation domain-containing protein
MMPALRNRDDGFTLTELLIAMAIGIVVFGTAGTTLVAYQNDAARSTRAIDSQEGARVAVDRIVHELRNVASSRTNPTLVEVAGPYNLVFQTIAPPPGGSANPVGVSRVRYCIPPNPAPGTPAQAALFAQRETWTTSTVPPNPWTSTSACPAQPGSVPPGATVSTTKLTTSVTNRYAGADRAAFTYDNGSLPAITTIGVNLFVDVSPTQAPAETELSSAAFLRNQNQAPVAAFTNTATGAGHVLLNGGGSSDPDNQPLTFKWSQVTGGVDVTIGSTGLLDWVPSTGPGQYTIKLQVTDSGGLIGTEVHTVTVS